MPHHETEVPSVARRFLPLMEAFIDNIRHSFIVGCKDLAGDCNTYHITCFSLYFFIYCNLI